jgi:hypothetical protein
MESTTHHGVYMGKEVAKIVVLEEVVAKLLNLWKDHAMKFPNIAFLV